MLGIAVFFILHNLLQHVSAEQEAIIGQTGH
jgi:hypothetical protein